MTRPVLIISLAALTNSTRSVSHSPFTSSRDVVEHSADLKSEVHTLKLYDRRILVKETDKGVELSRQIEVLKTMLREYYGFFG